MSDELQPCLRCASLDVGFVVDGDHISCRRCNLTSPKFDDFEEAIRWWNDRPAEALLRQRIAELEQQLAQTWQPVENDYHVQGDGVLLDVDNGERVGEQHIVFADWMGISGITLPPNVRLCKRSQ